MIKGNIRCIQNCTGCVSLSASMLVCHQVTGNSLLSNSSHFLMNKMHYALMQDQRTQLGDQRMPAMILTLLNLYFLCLLNQWKHILIMSERNWLWSFHITVFYLHLRATLRKRQIMFFGHMRRESLENVIIEKSSVRGRRGCRKTKWNNAWWSKMVIWRNIINWIDPERMGPRFMKWHECKTMMKSLRDFLFS